MLCVYQFKVVLRGVSPMIWRRLLLRSDHTIADLHYAIQIAIGERWRNEEMIATGFVESAVNQIVSKRFAKKQQMQWTKKSAHLVLQMRTQEAPAKPGYR